MPLLNPRIQCSGALATVEIEAEFVSLLLQGQVEAFSAWLVVDGMALTRLKLAS